MSEETRKSLFEENDILIPSSYEPLRPSLKFNQFAAD